MFESVFMFGSCVTSDCIPLFEAKKIRLLRHVSAQSVITARAGAQRPSEHMGSVSLASEFRHRSLIGDLSGSLLPELRQELRGSSYLLMDLVDERGGIWMDTAGKTATNSVELNQSGVLDHWSSGRRLIGFGTDEHFALWSEAISAFARELDDIGAGLRASVIKAPWAAEGIEGDTFPFGQSKLDPGRMNALYERYFNFLDEFTGIHVLEVPKPLCLTTRRHQWGMAPYHYVPEVQDFVVNSVVHRMELLDVDRG